MREHINHRKRGGDKTQSQNKQPNVQTQSYDINKTRNTTLKHSIVIVDLSALYADRGNL